MTPEKDNYTKRKKDHDYKGPCHYHIILKKRKDFPDFGTVAGDPDIPYKFPGCAFINKTKAGKIIGSHFFNLNNAFPKLLCHQYIVMPDHVHAFIQVMERLDKHLGYFINLLKINIANEISLKLRHELLSTMIFEKSYTDKIVYPGREYKTIIRYIEKNPERRAFKFKYPHFFERRYLMNINGIDFEAYGNHFLMDNPFKMQVKYFRKKTEAENDLAGELCLDNSASDGVLVSPFYHDKEKMIRKKAEEHGGKIILIQKEPFGEKYRPAEYNFNRCIQGILLIVAPVNNIFPSKFNYTTGKILNAVAAEIAMYNNY